MRRVRVLHLITKASPIGGAQLNTLLTAAGQAEAGYAVDLACGEYGELVEEAKGYGLETYCFPHLYNGSNPLRDGRAFFSLVRFLRSQPYDIVHTHSTKAGLLGRLAAWMARAPIVVHTIHGTPFTGNFERPIVRFLTRWGEVVSAWYTDRLVAVGELVRREFLDAHVCRPDKIETVYSGVRFDELDVEVDTPAKREELGLSAQDRVVLAVGNLEARKGYDVLVRAAARMTQIEPAVRVLIAGEGEEREALEAQIGQAGLEGRVRLLGTRKDVGELLAISEVFVRPSLYGEGMGRSVTEAMYVGLPTVVSEVNGIMEIVRHGETGLLVPPGEDEPLAQETLRLLQDAELAARLGRRAREEIAPLFSHQRMVQDTIALYERLIAAKAPWLLSAAPLRGRPIAAGSANTG